MIFEKRFKQIEDKMDKMEHDQLKCSTSTKGFIKTATEAIKKNNSRLMWLPIWLFGIGVTLVGGSLGIGLTVNKSSLDDQKAHYETFVTTLVTLYTNDIKKDTNFKISEFKNEINLKMIELKHKVDSKIRQTKDSTNENTRLYSNNCPSSIGELTFSPPVQEKN